MQKPLAPPCALVRSEWRVGHEFYRQIQRTGGGLVSLPAHCIGEADESA